MPTRLTMKLWPEAANALGVSRTTIYKLAKDGSLPTIKLGSRVLVPIAALNKLLEGAAA
jgi:excisionase family DNA binding protein